MPTAAPGQTAATSPSEPAAGRRARGGLGARRGGAPGPHRDRKAYDLLLQGEAGVIALTGTPDAPAKVGVSVADIASGMYAFSSVLAALLQRQATSRGSEIQTSMLEALVEWVMPA